MIMVNPILSNQFLERCPGGAITYLQGIALAELFEMMFVFYLCLSLMIYD